LPQTGVGPARPEPQKNGKSASLETAAPSGSLERPLGADRRADKFRDGARHTVRPIGDAVVETILSSCLDLTAVADITALTRALA
jgi:hypothetical protein